MRGVRSWARLVHGVSFLFTSWAYVWFLWYTALDYAPLFRSLHAVEFPYSGGAETQLHVPRSYMTLDWVMHPAVDAKTDMIPPMTLISGGYACQANGPNFDKELKSCSPEWWQWSSACSASGTYADGAALKTAIESGSEATGDDSAAVVKQFYNPTDETNNENMVLKNSKLVWPAPTMKDACRIERIGAYALVQNDNNAWSLGGAHSADLLVAGAAVTLWLVNAFAIINLTYIFPMNDETRAQNTDRVRLFKFVLAFLALLAPVVVRLASTQTKTVGSDVYYNPLPNGSYFYVLLAAFWAATISFYTPCFAYEKQDDETEVAEVVAHETEPRAVPVEGSSRGFELDTSSFYTKKKLSVDAYLTRSAPLGKEGQTLRTYDEGFIFKEHCFNFARTHIADDYYVNFELAQLFTFPLLLLAVYAHYNNYAVDSYTQMLFLAGVGYSLLDVFARRVVVGGRVYDELCQHASIELRRLGKDERYPLRDTLMQCCACHAVRACHLLSVALQLLLAVVIFFCMRWQLALGSFGERRSNALVDGWRREMVLDYSGFAFVVYVFLSAGVKLLYSFWSEKFQKPAYGKLILLVLFFFYVLINVVIMAESHTDGVNGIFEFQKYRVKFFSDSEARQMHVAAYSAGWVQTN